MEHKIRINGTKEMCYTLCWILLVDLCSVAIFTAGSDLDFPGCQGAKG